MTTKTGQQRLTPLQWTLVFIGAWLIGWVAFMLASGTPFQQALNQALPLAVALSILAYSLRIYRK